ncbi:MAG: nucleotidyltransferase domain-containing protein [Candidatus Bipolaricaulota bacterium]|nr:nucleotidyltransferase domain-containing protein [Candidatus Bipolaricaulota bacterium]
MPTSRLAQALFPESRAAILAAVDTAGDEGLHLREVARRTNLNSKTVMRELHALRDAGVLVSRDVGRQVIYRLNPHCPIAEELRSIIRKTVGLAGVLQTALKPVGDRIEQAYVYGSFARGKERADSDVDLMVVGSVSLRELSSPVRAAGRSLRRTVNPTLYTPEDYRRELADRDSFVSRAHRGARIDLLGGSR